MKTLYWLGAGLLAGLVLRTTSSAAAASNKIAEAVPRDGTNFITGGVWDVLNGSGMAAFERGTADHPSLMSPNAHPPLMDLSNTWP